MWWHELSWPEIDKLDKNTPVVIPLGSIEQHGHHLPVVVDTLQVTAIAERVEAQLKDDIAVLPTLWLGSSHHHIDFPGTVSAKPSLYSEILKTIARSILNAGFKKLLFLNGHGGNQVPGAQALTELVAEDDKADEAYLVFSSWWHIGGDKVRNAEGMTTPFITHACEYETSLVMAIRPDLAHPERVVENTPALNSEWSAFETGGRVNVYRRWRYMSAAGAMGKPSQAGAEKGAKLLENVTNEAVSFLKEFKTWPELPVIGPKRPE